MAFKIVDCDNVRESFTSTGTTITAGGAVTNSRALSAVLSNGDTFFGVARKGAEVSIGIFTWSTGGSIAQTTVWYSTNSNNAVSFSSGTGEIFMDAPSRLFDELNLLAITVASATTCDIGAVHGAKITISGTTTITSLGTSANKRRFVKFSGALTLTHNATSLILPGGKNIPTAAGDTAIFLSDSSGNWTCWNYTPASGRIVSVKRQVFTAGATWTPSTGMAYASIRLVGGGGGGGGGASTTGGQVSSGGGGGAGGYADGVFTAATVGASQTVTIGAAGTAGTAGANNGGNGGTTSVGSLISATGGTGGTGGTAFGAGQGATGGAGGAGTTNATGTAVSGQTGSTSFNPAVTGSQGGSGGNSLMGLGAATVATGGTVTGLSGTGYGSGGGGGANGVGQGAGCAGGAGKAGYVEIVEFCTQ